ncbi:SDR family oxidoreductase [Ectopseudomonas mendocina]|uniref:SDR family oxidoreductase n=1 Tax=Ectopseudomonas mendocina TaxID=300 RepID=UPI0012DB465E
MRQASPCLTRWRRTRLRRFSATLDLNLTAAFACSYLALPLHAVRRLRFHHQCHQYRRRIGLSRQPGVRRSKGGLAAMTRALARDYGARGIR